MSEYPTAPSTRSPGFWVSALAILGLFALFALIVYLAYLPQKPQPLSHGSNTPEQRKQTLNELRAADAKAAGSYGWIDQPKGVVQLPLDRAVELTVQEINRGQRQ